MSEFYNINDITLGAPSHSGHEAYLDARHKFNNEKIIYKKNKHGYPSFSCLEVSFSRLAKLFLSPDLTPAQSLVVDDERQVVGIAVQHLCYNVANKEGLRNSFYTLKDPSQGCATEAYQPTDPADIKIYFLDKLPQGFYARLVKAEKKGELTIDYESLASILTTSYTLEEDDLHKGNFGFYLVEKNGKPQVVFFKIDHDLMFVDSIMGFYTRRPFHLFHGPGAFDIHAEDLRVFANLKHSSNSYWPTKFGYIANPFEGKEYHSFADIRAFGRLATNPAFIRAKWLSFYKHILIPTDLILETLNSSADVNNPADRAHVALIAQAMIARLSLLSSVLFTIPEFREFIMNLSVQAEEELLLQILPEQKSYEPLIRDSIKQFRVLCTTSTGFVEGDTPLHTAIKLGEYRYEDSWRMFGQYLNEKNSLGQTPLDVAVEQLRLSPAINADIRKDTRNIMKHLLAKGATPTEHFQKAGIQNEIQNYVFKNPFLNLITANISYDSFKGVLRDIGEDHCFCLKDKKDTAIECIKYWISLKRKDGNFYDELMQLKKDVNGKSTEYESAGLKYFRQLRSRLWIVRQFRGLYGWTTTQSSINNLIDEAASTISPEKISGYRPFFANYKSESIPVRQPDVGLQF